MNALIEPTIVDHFKAGMVNACSRVGNDAVLLLSGGLDSGVILAGLLEAGIDFDIATMRFGNIETGDEQAARLRHLAMAPHKSFSVVELPRDEAAAKAVVIWTILDAYSMLKTTIEVMVVMKPMIEELHRRGYKTIINGMAGGALWGFGREPYMLLKRCGEEAWSALRWLNVEYDKTGYPPVATRMCRLLCAKLGVNWVDPLFELDELMLDASFAELNKPREKSLAVRAFPELGKTPVVSSGLQVEQGVREFMEFAIAKPAGFHTSQAYYGHVSREHGIAVRGTPHGADIWKSRAIAEGRDLTGLDRARAALKPFLESKLLSKGKEARNNFPPA